MNSEDYSDDDENASAIDHREEHGEEETEDLSDNVLAPDSRFPPSVDQQFEYLYRVSGLNLRYRDRHDLTRIATWKLIRQEDYMEIEQDNNETSPQLLLVIDIDVLPVDFLTNITKTAVAIANFTFTEIARTTGCNLSLLTQMTSLEISTGQFIISTKPQCNDAYTRININVLFSMLIFMPVYLEKKLVSSALNLTADATTTTTAAAVGNTIPPVMQTQPDLITPPPTTVPMHQINDNPHNQQQHQNLNNPPMNPDSPVVIQRSVESPLSESWQGSHSRLPSYVDSAAEQEENLSVSSEGKSTQSRYSRRTISSDRSNETQSSKESGSDATMISSINANNVKQRRKKRWTTIHKMSDARKQQIPVEQHVTLAEEMETNPVYVANSEPIVAEDMETNPVHVAESPRSTIPIAMSTDGSEAAVGGGTNRNSGALEATNITDEIQIEAPMSVETSDAPVYVGVAMQPTEISNTPSIVLRPNRLAIDEIAQEMTPNLLTAGEVASTSNTNFNESLDINKYQKALNQEVENARLLYLQKEKEILGLQKWHKENKRLRIQEENEKRERLRIQRETEERERLQIEKENEERERLRIQRETEERERLRIQRETEERERLQIEKENEERERLRIQRETEERERLRIQRETEERERLRIEKENEEREKLRIQRETEERERLRIEKENEERERLEKSKKNSTQEEKNPKKHRASTSSISTRVTSESKTGTKPKTRDSTTFRNRSEIRDENKKSDDGKYRDRSEIRDVSKTGAKSKTRDTTKFLDRGEIKGSKTGGISKIVDGKIKKRSKLNETKTMAAVHDLQDSSTSGVSNYSVTNKSNIEAKTKKNITKKKSRQSKDLEKMKLPEETHATPLPPRKQKRKKNDIEELNTSQINIKTKKSKPIAAHEIESIEMTNDSESTAVTSESATMVNKDAPSNESESIEMASDSESTTASEASTLTMLNKIDDTLHYF
ncbi:hypothetical protein DOLIC_00090 [Dolichomitus sp. PSUC_FEM 10030005]|nr:hypothetical protein [Dolichomitus sp. PSUC_FEM 10030005]